MTMTNEVVKFLDDLRIVVDTTRGVDGWHLNNTLASWEELPITVDRIDKLKAMLEQPPDADGSKNVEKLVEKYTHACFNASSYVREKELLREFAIGIIQQHKPEQVEEDLVKWLGADETSMNMKAFNAFYNREFNERCIAKIETLLSSKPTVKV